MKRGNISVSGRGEIGVYCVVNFGRVEMGPHLYKKKKKQLKGKFSRLSSNKN